MKKLTIKQRLDKKEALPLATIILYDLYSHKVIYYGSYAKCESKYLDMIPECFSEVHKKSYFEIGIKAVSENA